MMALSLQIILNAIFNLTSSRAKGLNVNYIRSFTRRTLHADLYATKRSATNAKWSYPTYNRFVRIRIYIYIFSSFESQTPETFSFYIRCVRFVDRQTIILKKISIRRTKYSESRERHYISNFRLCFVVFSFPCGHNSQERCAYNTFSI